MKSSFTPFKNKWFFLALFAVLLQQFLVAGGTYCLGELSRQFPISGFNTTLALLLFTCVFLPGTVFHYWVLRFTIRAYKSAQLSYFGQYIRINYNIPTHWRNEESKHLRHDIMCRGGQDALKSSVNFFVDSSATALNIILNTISIVLVTDLIFGIVIIVAGVLGIGIVHYSRRKIADSSREEMLTENQLNSHLSRSWDNIILGNKLFFDRWENHFNELFSMTEEASLQVVRKRDWTVSLAGMVTNGLVLGGALGLSWIYQSSTGFVLALLVMLPRSLQIVIHIQIIQSYIAQWKSLREKLAVARESLSEVEPLKLDQYIQEDLIRARFNNENYSILDVRKFLEDNKVGRITITGPNSAGKSSLLLNWKNTFNSSAIYIPAQHQIMFRQSQLGLSSGEVALTALKDVKTAKEHILLLDEWDANLSPENCRLIDKLIDQLGQEKMIVEVRHS